MIDLSFAGLLGAFLGTGVAAVVYGPLIAYLQHVLEGGATSGPAGNGAGQAEQQTALAEASLLRRCVLAADILLCAGLGYWAGTMIADRLQG